MNLLLAILMGYALGSLPFSYMAPKLFKGIDIRTVGSGNVGATNVLRTVGWPGALFAFVGDIAKGILATWLALIIWGESAALLAGIFSMIGHCYSVFLGFKGGKGVTTSAGIVLVLSPPIFAILLAFQILAIGTTKIVSLSSILAAVLFPLLAILLDMSQAFIIFSLIMSLFVIYRHRSNIVRLIRFEEPTLGKKAS